MNIDHFEFGKIIIDSKVYTNDLVIHKGKLKKRQKKASKKYRSQFGHTPVSVDEKIPWDCQTLVIGSGYYGSLPVMDEVHEKARKLGVELVIKTTPEALLHINESNTNLILHLTC